MAEQMRMPSGMGGLVRYFDEYKSKIVISPYIVIGIIVFVIILEALLHLLGKGFLA
ncbi:MAG: preprotein translocase subunit Sec61beta [Candidatus Woesearchaeota archaeon]|nr:MAG: preprotein translocase subunit Sec61beta [Candidatus Woesearchaeota archaeon]